MPMLSMSNWKQIKDFKKLLKSKDHFIKSKTQILVFSIHQNMHVINMWNTQNGYSFTTSNIMPRTAINIQMNSFNRWLSTMINLLDIIIRLVI